MGVWGSLGVWGVLGFRIWSFRLIDAFVYSCIALGRLSGAIANDIAANVIPPTRCEPLRSKSS